KIDKMGDRLTGGAAMDEVGATVGAKPLKFGPVDVDGNPTASEQQAAKAAAEKSDAAEKAAKAAGDATETISVTGKSKPNSDWLATAFQTQQGETSGFQDDKKGGYYAV